MHGFLLGDILRANCESYKLVIALTTDNSRTMVFPALDPEEVEELKAAFKEADKEGKGKLSAKEVQRVLTAVICKFELEDVKGIMSMVDDDGDRMLNYKELSKLFTKLPDSNYEPMTEGMFEEWKTMFKTVDVDKDKKLSKKEIAKLIEIWAEGLDPDSDSDSTHPVDIKEEAKRAASEWMKTFDEDGDKRINYREFIEIIKAVDTD